MNRVPLEDCIQSERRSGLIRPQWCQFGLMKNYDGVLHPFMFAACAVLSMYANNLGEEIFNARGFSMADGDAYVGTPDYADGYRDQLNFVNTMAVRTLTEILESSSVPPIIVLQADHGPGARLRWESVEETDLRERMSILNAYYLPGVDPGELYPSITPVNSFRLIFNLYFGTGYRLLEDENFFSSPTRPYDLLKVTDQVQDG